MAPNLSLQDLLRYTDPAFNPITTLFETPDIDLVEPIDGLPYFQFKDGPKVFLWQRFPALDLFSQCTLCFTTVGANTAQLGALGIPMIIILATQSMGVIQIAEDGLGGLIFKLPGVGAIARHLINPLIVRSLQKSGKLLGWPNIWAKREVVPELLGPVTPADICQVALDYLNHPGKLAATRQALRELRGPMGAADKMATLILETLS